MATKAKPQHAHGHGHDRHHSHSKLALKSKPAKNIDDFLDAPVLACYARNSLPFIMTVPDSDFSTVQEHFVPSAELKSIVAKAVASRSTSTTAETGSGSNTPFKEPSHDHMSNLETFPRVKLDRRFKIGFSRLHGHSIELRKDNNVHGETTTDSDSKVESGTRLFEKDELPYASLIEEVWRGKLCEECLSVLPKEDGSRVPCTCTECPPTVSIASSQSKVTSQPLLDDEELYKGGSVPYEGPAIFCSESCREVAWASWHRFECRYANELKQLSKQTRLALRIFWKNRRYNIRMNGGSTSPCSNITARTTTSPSNSISKATSSSLIPKSSSAGSVSPTSPTSVSKIAKLTKAAAGLSLDGDGPRIPGSDTNGSSLTPARLCHNFQKINHITRMSYIMTGYYLQHLLGLTESAELSSSSPETVESQNELDNSWTTVSVVTMELAYLQALVQFNSFSIKADVSEPATGSDMMMRVNHYVIGSGVYLLASLLNHSCAPSAMVVFGNNTKTRIQMDNCGDPNGVEPVAGQPDPRKMNVVTTRLLKLDLTKDRPRPVSVEISYGPQGGRMATDLRKETLMQSHLFECNCTACNDMYAETMRQKMFKCPKGGYACRAMTDSETTCATCGAEVDMALRHKMTQLMARLLTESQDPYLSLTKRLTILRALESTQAKTFVNTCVLYGNTCDQLAMVHAQSGELGQSIEWCKKALRVVTVHFPQDSIEVAQETLKLAGLYFNNLQPKEAKMHVQTAIRLYRGHYGSESEHPDLMELYEMEKTLQSFT